MTVWPFSFCHCATNLGIIASWAALVTAKETRVNSTLPLLAVAPGLAPGLAAGLLVPPVPQDATARLNVIPNKNSDTKLLSEVNN